MSTANVAADNDFLRERAVRRLKKQADFRVHVLVYVLVNTFLVVIWVWTGMAFFWPIFPIFGWGIGVGVNALDAYGPHTLTERRIQREMTRLQRSA